VEHAHHREGAHGVILGIDYDTHDIWPCLLSWEDDAHEFIGPISLRPKKATGEDSLWRAIPWLHQKMHFAIPWREVDVVWIERGQTSTGMRGPFMLGAVFGALLAACGELMEDNDSVNAIETREWKKIVAPDVPGGANAKKPVTHAAMLERWPELAGVNPNFIDAFAIVYAGRELNARAIA
jgi:hypothetical protein